METLDSFFRVGKEMLGEIVGDASVDLLRHGAIEPPPRPVPARAPTALVRVRSDIEAKPGPALTKLSANDIRSLS